ncbi:DUF1799 domain-containing protein [Ottowia flava]|uniref:DUF1799 domain-containing protein n=1 Tax=Ottowia flava TaxID=2675430 RepID=A0ABW4KQI3_9BURK|nr:DUF1799 domain-containing protein [Ottowia sp. GY511]
MEASGWEPEDFEEVPCDVWPAHIRAFELACYLRRQLRTSFSGVLGFDLGPADAWMRRRGIPDSEQIVLEQQLADIEIGMLKTVNKKKD